jgi:hypothetical protein
VHEHARAHYAQPPHRAGHGGDGRVGAPHVHAQARAQPPGGDA